MKKPNIILFMCDQLRFDALGCYGNNEIHTPNIDKLALDGSSFDDHFCQSPVCMPSRASIMTGRYPRNHGTRDNGIPLRDSEVTFVEMLRDEGYSTHTIGKMHLTSMLTDKVDEHEDWPEDNYGFDHIHTTTDNKDGAYLEWLKNTSFKDYEIVKKQGEDKIKEDTASASAKQQTGAPQVNVSKVDAKYHQSAWIADKTIEAIEYQDDKPFFIMSSFVDPHHPFDPPKEYYEKYIDSNLTLPIHLEDELKDKPPHFRKHEKSKGFGNEKYDYRSLSDDDWRKVKAAYYGMITLIDDNIGRVMKTLEEKGMQDDTLILFTSDHGELLGDHGILFKGPFHYDSVIKIPFIIKYPGQIPQGSRYSNMTEHIDIMPTILEYAGIQTPYGVQGQSLTPILRGDTGASRDYVLTESKANDWGLEVKTITGRDYKLTYYANEKYGELYDRNEDPEEFFNLWEDPEYACIKQDLIKVLLDRLINSEDPLPIRVGKY